MKKTGPDFGESRCPHCGHLIDTGALFPESGETFEKPKANDLGVCIRCGRFLVYVDDRGNARKMTPKDFAQLDAELRDELIKVQLTIRTLHEQH